MTTFENEGEQNGGIFTYRGRREEDFGRTVYPPRLGDVDDSVPTGAVFNPGLRLTPDMFEGPTSNEENSSPSEEVSADESDQFADELLNGTAETYDDLVDRAGVTLVGVTVDREREMTPEEYAARKRGEQTRRSEQRMPAAQEPDIYKTNTIVVPIPVKTVATHQPAQVITTDQSAATTELVEVHAEVVSEPEVPSAVVVPFGPPRPTRADLRKAREEKRAQDALLLQQAKEDQREWLRQRALARQQEAEAARAALELAKSDDSASDNNEGEHMSTSETGTELAVPDNEVFVNEFMNPVNPDTLTVTPWYHDPFKYRSDKQARDAAKQTWDDYVSLVEEAQRENGFSDEFPIDINTLGEQTTHETNALTRSMLPPAIQRGPAADHISTQTAKRAFARFERGTDEVRAQVDARGLLPFEHTHEHNQALMQLAQESKDAGIKDVMLDVPRLEAAQRVAAALSESDHISVSIPLEVVTNTGDKEMMVDAWQSVHVVEHESPNGGIVLGRSDEKVELVRSNGSNQKTFRSTVGVVQDIQDPAMTLVYALEPGALRMPGGEPKQLGIPGYEDWGTLKIDAVAVDASRFLIKMVNELRTPEVETVEVVGEAGERIVTEVRTPVNLIDAARYIARVADIGVTHPVQRVETNRRAIASFQVGTGDDIRNPILSGDWGQTDPNEILESELVD